MRRREAATRAAQEAYLAAVRARLTEIAEKQEDRLAMADKLRDSGDVGAAAAIYLRLAGLRTKTKTVLAARERFIEMREQGTKKLAEIDAVLTQRNQSSGNSQDDAYNKVIHDAFAQYRKLELQYAKVPGIGSKIRSHVNKQRRTPEFAAVLNEPEAKELFQLGRELEAKGQICCAFHLYEEAKQVRHAPSAQFAAERYAALRRDPEVVASAKTCADLQWCHTEFDRATRMVSINPRKAQSMFKEIVARAPADSKVHLEARRKLGDT